MTVLRVTSRALADAGFVVETAKNGFIGLNKIFSTFPATPLSDSTRIKERDHKADEDEREQDKIREIKILNGLAAKEDIRAVGDKINDEDGVVKNVNKETPQQRVEGPPPSIQQRVGPPPSEGGGRQNLVVHLPVVSYVEPFDFILMDIQMPVMDGIEATLRLRAKETAYFAESPSGLIFSKHLIIIGMSANSDAETKRLAIEAGMQYFLAKPFTIAEFKALLDSIIAEQK
mmetsp:Transcript_25322/g.24222  ORF Transcript_25322/g.24222 Transcript_25322/m.24222 type:complete len:231 (-) Transcript_25322:546-1238(-)